MSKNYSDLKHITKEKYISFNFGVNMNSGAWAHLTKMVFASFKIRLTRQNRFAVLSYRRKKVCFLTVLYFFNKRIDFEISYHIANV